MEHAVYDLSRGIRIPSHSTGMPKRIHLCQLDNGPHWPIVSRTPRRSRRQNHEILEQKAIVKYRLLSILYGKEIFLYHGEVALRGKWVD